MYLEHGPSWATLAAWRWGEGGGHLQNIAQIRIPETPLSKYCTAHRVRLLATLDTTELINLLHVRYRKRFNVFQFEWFYICYRPIELKEILSSSSTYQAKTHFRFDIEYLQMSPLLLIHFKYINKNNIHMHDT